MIKYLLLALLGLTMVSITPTAEARDRHRHHRSDRWERSECYRPSRSYYRESRSYGHRHHRHYRSYDDCGPRRDHSFGRALLREIFSGF